MLELDAGCNCGSSEHATKYLTAGFSSLGKFHFIQVATFYIFI